MQDAQSHLLNLAEEHQHAFETEIVENANRWMEYQRKNFRQLAMSDLMIWKRVEVLEPASAQSYSIDTENDVVMNAAPALPLAIEPPPHYAGEVAACMINEKYQPWLNEVGRQFIALQDQLAELQKQVAEVYECQTPLELAFSEVVRSRGTTLSVKTSGPRHVLSGLRNLAPFHREIIETEFSTAAASGGGPRNPLSVTTIVDSTCPLGSGRKSAGDSYRTRTTLCRSRANPSTHHSIRPSCLCLSYSTTRTSKAFG